MNRVRLRGRDLRRRPVRARRALAYMVQVQYEEPTAAPVWPVWVVGVLGALVVVEAVVGWVVLAS